MCLLDNLLYIKYNDPVGPYFIFLDVIHPYLTYPLSLLTVNYIATIMVCGCDPRLLFLRLLIFINTKELNFYKTT